MFPAMLYHESGRIQKVFTQEQQDHLLSQPGWGDRPITPKPPKKPAEPACPDCERLEARLVDLRHKAQKKIDEQAKQLESLSEVLADLQEQLAAANRKLEKKQKKSDAE
jgi:flagellar motility protein MotE (MotC chaperone)